MTESPIIPPPRVQTLSLPFTIVNKKNGFSLDFGYSVLKITYVLEKEGNVCLNFVSFPRDNLDEALQYIKDTMGGHMCPEEQVFVTGVGCNHHKEKLEKDLDIKLSMVLECDAHAAGFSFLSKHYSLEEVMHPPSEAIHAYAWQAAQGTMVTLRALADLSTAGKYFKAHPKELPKPEDLTLKAIEFPALVFVVGSGFFDLLIHEDGSYDILGYMANAGRCMVGTGSMIAETQSFEELIKFAQRGDSSKLNTPFDRLVKTDEQDVYTDFMTEMENSVPLYFFGEAVGKNREDFSREDRAAAVVTLACHSLALHCQSMAMLLKAKHVYCIGGIFNSQIVRDEFGKHFIHRSLMSYNETYTQPHFVKFGAYCGAVGAFLQNLGVVKASGEKRENTM